MLMESMGVALAFMLVAAKFNITTLRRILAYHAVVDVVVTVGLMIALQGTMSGMVIAIFAGAILSIALVIARKILGYEKRVIRRCSLGHIHTEWESQPAWKRPAWTRRIFA